MAMKKVNLAEWKSQQEEWLLEKSGPAFEAAYRVFEREYLELEQELALDEDDDEQGDQDFWEGALDEAAVDESPQYQLLHSDVELSREEEYELAQLCARASGKTAEKTMAMEKLSLAAYRKVWKWSWHILTNEADKANVYRRVQQEDVEDLVSEAFVRAFEGIKGFKGNSSFSSFVNGCVKNIVMEQQKRNRFDNKKDKDERYTYASVIRLDALTATHREAIEQEISERNEDEEEIFEARQEQNALVRKAWKDLPHELEMVLFWQFDVTDCPYNTTAALMGIERHDVDNWIRKAKKLVKQRLLEAAFNPETNWRCAY